MLGWAAVSPVSSRPAYAGVVEHSVYVAEAARGQGLGSRLLRALTPSTEQHGIWTIQSSVFPENHASLRLHESNGFSIVGRRERIARMSHGPAAGQWRDTLLLERRSGLPGLERATRPAVRRALSLGTRRRGRDGAKQFDVPRSLSPRAPATNHNPHAGLIFPGDLSDPRNPGSQSSFIQKRSASAAPVGIHPSVTSPVTLSRNCAGLPEWAMRAQYGDAMIAVGATTEG